MRNNHLDYKEDNPNYNTLENELQLKDYFLILRIHLKKIIYLFIIFLMVGIYSTYSKVPKYRATASVIIMPKPGSQSLEGFGTTDNNNQINNKISLLKSRALLKLVVKEFWVSNRRNNMFLFDTRKYYPKGQTVRTIIKEIFTLGLYDVNESRKSLILNGPYSDEIVDDYVKKLQSNMRVYRQGNTNLIKVDYQSTNADEARRIANSIVGQFVKKDKEWTNKYAINSIAFLDSLVHLQESKIENNDNKKMRFMLDNNLYSMEAKSEVIIAQINTYELELYNIDTEIKTHLSQVELLKSKFSDQELNLTSQLMNNINIQIDWYKHLMFVVKLIFSKHEKPVDNIIKDLLLNRLLAIVDNNPKLIENTDNLFDIVTYVIWIGDPISAFRLYENREIPENIETKFSNLDVVADSLWYAPGTDEFEDSKDQTCKSARR